MSSCLDKFTIFDYNLQEAISDYFMTCDAEYIRGPLSCDKMLIKPKKVDYIELKKKKAYETEDIVFKTGKTFTDLPRILLKLIDRTILLIDNVKTPTNKQFYKPYYSDELVLNSRITTISGLITFLHDPSSGCPVYLRAEDYCDKLVLRTTIYFDL